jgi:hypothetical protein
VIINILSGGTGKYTKSNVVLDMYYQFRPHVRIRPVNAVFGNHGVVRYNTHNTVPGIWLQVAVIPMFQSLVLPATWVQDLRVLQEVSE